MGKPQFLALKLFLYDLAISVFFILKRLDSLKYTSEIWKCAVIGLNFLTACFKRRFWRIIHDEAFPKTSAWEAISKNSYVRHHCLQSCFCYSALKRVVRSACRCMSIASNTHAEVTCWYKCATQRHIDSEKKNDSFVSRVTNLNNKNSKYKFPTLNSSATD